MKSRRHAGVSGRGRIVRWAIVACALMALVITFWLLFVGHRQGDVNASAAKDTAQRFFRALASGDHDTANTIFSAPLSPSVWNIFLGMEVVSISRPVLHEYHHDRDRWWVPYEIRLKGGQMHEGRLSVRNDTPDKKWQVDGGL